MIVITQPPFARDGSAVYAAVQWAARKHGRQRREGDGAPFILHPLEVAALLSGRGYDDDVIVAGVLHDVLEKTSATASELRARFGDRVAGIVEAVTEDCTIAEFGERKAALRDQVARAGEEVCAVYAADKIAKARELRQQTACACVRPDEPGYARKLEHYQQGLEMLRVASATPALAEQLAFELWALRVLPPEN